MGFPLAQLPQLHRSSWVYAAWAPRNPTMCQQQESQDFPCKLAGGWKVNTIFTTRKPKWLRNQETHTCPGYGWYDGVVFIFVVLVAETQFRDFVVRLGLSEVTEGWQKDRDKDNIILAAGLGCNQSSSFWYIMWVIICHDDWIANISSGGAFGPKGWWFCFPPCWTVQVILSYDGFIQEYPMYSQSISR